MAGKDYVNLFDLTYDAINTIKKKHLVDYIEKIVADNQIQNLCNEIANVKRLVSTNERLTSELSIVKKVKNVLKNRIVNLEKQLSKSELYGRRSNVEIPGISNQIPDQNLEENVVKICKDSVINISPMDIEGCHRLPLGRNSTNTTK